MNIVIYTKSGCPNCVTAKNLLKTNGLHHEEYDISAYPDAFFANFPDVRQMPQLFVNGVRIGGLAGLQAYLPDILAGRIA